jgi:muramoyltetrapeptide carboxypeptidase
MAIRPSILQRGDTVGIVSLASPLPAEEIDKAITILESTGLHVALGKYVYSKNGFLAGTDQERASEFMSMFENPNVRMIMSTRGGTGSSGILPYLDYKIIARNPKIVSGYSDISEEVDEPSYKIIVI